MSYQPNDLSVLAYANNFTLWHYVTKDAAISEKGYFNDGVRLFRKGDLIIANLSTETNPKTDIFTVLNSDENNVTIVPFNQ